MTVNKWSSTPDAPMKCFNKNSDQIAQLNLKAIKLSWQPKKYLVIGTEIETRKDLQKGDVLVECITGSKDYKNSRSGHTLFFRGNLDKLTYLFKKLV